MGGSGASRTVASSRWGDPVAWSDSEAAVVCTAIRALALRPAIEDFLRSTWDVRASESPDGTVYRGPGLGLYVRVRYEQGRAISAVAFRR